MITFTRHLHTSLELVFISHARVYKYWLYLKRSGLCNHFSVSVNQTLFVLRE
jgi:hypothetical protein